MIFDRASWLVLAAACGILTAADGWVWPEGSESVRIDTKVHFIGDEERARPEKSVATATASVEIVSKRNNVQKDDAPFREPTDTGGFYNQPPGAGRYPVQTVDGFRSAYTVDSANMYHVQSTKNNLEPLTICKCLNTPECAPRKDSTEMCGFGKYLCCYKRANQQSKKLGDFFNDIDDEPSILYPGKERLLGPFPPPDANPNVAGFVGPVGPPRQIGLNAAVLTGPNGPTGQIGPNRQLLVGPNGPTGKIGPNRELLTGPNGPTGQIGPDGQNEKFVPNRPILSGPNPTGVVGPAHDTNNNFQTDESAQRGVLFGPGGPTGAIGPYGQRGVLTGPGGPTGIVGPRGGSRGLLTGPGGPTGYIGPGYGRQSNPGILVGPGGPTGIIGPGRQLLVGPGGPTGRIGPQRYFGN